MEEKEIIGQPEEEIIQKELDALSLGQGKRKFARFIMGVLGAIPWVGGILGASAALKAEKEQDKTNELHRLWIEEHRGRFAELAKDISDILGRFEELHEVVKDRIESEDYLKLVRKAFKSWDNAETKEKRQYIKNLIINAAAIELCGDDLVRLFNDWIDTYHEAHFKVIREIYNKDGVTRAEIWDAVHQSRPREDSAEADLYKLLIRDLSTGGVIRQERVVNTYGEYIKQPKRAKGSSSSTYESAFEGTKRYVLTQLGEQFVHYTMNEAVARLAEE